MQPSMFFGVRSQEPNSLQTLCTLQRTGTPFVSDRCIYVSICLSTYLSIYLHSSIYLSIYIHIHSYIYIFLSFYLYIHHGIRLRERVCEQEPDSVQTLCTLQRTLVLWCFVLNPHFRPRYPTHGVIKESYD